MLDSYLASLYGVEVKTLNQAVKRNLARFPTDFMFRLSGAEWNALRFQIGALNERESTGSDSLRSQSVTLNKGRGRHRKYPPYAFTEQGVAMLSSVLRSQRAVNVNIEIMRTFVRLRKLLAANAELAARMDELERRIGKHDEQFVQVVRAIRQLMEPSPAPPRRRIGFHTTTDEAPPERQCGIRR